MFYTSNQFQSSLDPQLFKIDYDLMASLKGMERLTIPEGSPPWIRYCCLHIASYSRRNQQVPDFVFFRGIVRFQSNVEDHDPEVCSKNLTAWEDIESQCSTPPHFVPFGMNVSFNFQSGCSNKRRQQQLCRSLCSVIDHCPLIRLVHV